MTNYFAIHFSLNENLVGKVDQVKEYIHNCDVENDSRFIDKFPFQKIDIEPILSIPILHPKAKKTNFINVNGSVGFSFSSILISDRLRKIFEKFNIFGIDFYPTSVIQNTIEYGEYWQTHVFDLPLLYVDFEETTFTLKDRDVNRQVTTEIVKFKNSADFLQFANEIRYPKMISFSDVVFQENMNLDYFALRYTEASHSGIVSERLKNAIEESGITELEFRPIEVNYAEWSARDALRDQTYGRSW